MNKNLLQKFLLYAFYSFVFVDTFAQETKNQNKIFVDKFPLVEITLSSLEEDLTIESKKEDFKIIEWIHPENKKVVPVETFTILETEKKGIQKNGSLYSIILDSTKSLSKSDFEFLKKNIRDLIQNKKEEDLFALYSLNGGAKKIQNFTKNKKTLLEKLGNISLKGKETKLYDAIYTVLLDLTKFQKKRKEEMGGVLVFTDGKEETSSLNPKDIEDLIIYGTKFEIPIYFFLTKSTIKHSIFEKISLKTGGKIFYDHFQPSSIVEETVNDLLIIKSFTIRYKSMFNIFDTLLNPLITTEIYYKEKKIFNSLYSTSYYNRNWTIGIFIFFLLIIVLIVWFTWYFVKKNKSDQKIKDNKKIEFPESQIGEVFADLRQYSDKPEKKYIESEEKSDIPLIAKNWMEPTEIYDLEDPYIKKKLFKDTMNLSLKEKSYIVLQMALKEAPKYSHGVLVKKDREGLGYEKKYDLFLEEVYIGSSTSAHIPIRDSSISSIHAKIKKIDNKFILFDLMSLGGTYLNGKKVLRPMPLKHNDEIRMGHTVFRFIGET
ncbi:MAG: FHA domain-containing protein [Leptonema sp. (in: bacteria)]